MQHEKINPQNKIDETVEVINKTHELAREEN